MWGLDIFVIFTISHSVSPLVHQVISHQDKSHQSWQKSAKNAIFHLAREMSKFLWSGRWDSFFGRWDSRLSADFALSHDNTGHDVYFLSTRGRDLSFGILKNFYSQTKTICPWVCKKLFFHGFAIVFEWKAIICQQTFCPFVPQTVSRCHLFCSDGVSVSSILTPRSHLTVGNGQTLSNIICTNLLVQPFQIIFSTLSNNIFNLFK